jgi:PAS domain S-box-containing protein
MNRIETNRPEEGGGQTPSNEAARPVVLRGSGARDTVSDPQFEPIVRLAARLLGARGAAIILVDGSRVRLKAAIGTGWADWLREGGLAESALRHGAPMFAGDVRDASSPNADRTGATGFYATAPLVGASGQIIGLLCVADANPRAEPDQADRAALIDLARLVTDEITRDAEVAAVREQSRFDQERDDLALSAAGLVTYEWDLTNQSVVVSEAFRAMVGWDETQVPLADWPGMRALMHPEDREAIVSKVGESLAAHGRYKTELRLVRPKDGRVIWICSAGALVATGEGRPRRIIGVIQDITARKTEEEQRETLVAELDHRIKNVLAAVQSLAAQSARNASSLEGFLKTFAGRLKSMASAHQLLTATRWRGAGMHNIAAAELGGMAPGQTRWEGPDIVLTPRAANALSLALHELATNAIKFGSLSTETGRVDVTWRQTEDGGLELHWLESHGPAVVPPSRLGFGSTLLEKVTGRELGGSVRVGYPAEGVRAVLTVGPSAFAELPEPAPEARIDAEPAAIVEASPGSPPIQRAIHISGLKLLIVEDALLLALELEAGLTEAGAEVLASAADVEEAMLMVDLPIDAAVLDANLNGASVLPVAQALAKRGVPFVFATGYGDGNALPFDFDAPVIRKPYDVTQVAAALSEVTGRSEPPVQSAEPEIN